MLIAGAAAAFGRTERSICPFTPVIAEIATSNNNFFMTD
jgi:hypothetical protein